MSNTETKPTALGGMGPKEAKKEITGYTKTSLSCFLTNMNRISG